MRARRTRAWYCERSDGRRAQPGRRPWSSQRRHARANLSRRVRGTRGRRLVDGGPRTGRAGSLCPSVHRTCNSSLRPATAFGDARPPTRHGRGSTPSLSPPAADVQPPTLALKRSVLSSFWVPLIFSLFPSFKKFRERECGQPAARSRANRDQNKIGEACGTHSYLFPFFALFVFSK